MAPRIRAIHKTYFRELETVGRMLTDYGELELGLMNCIAVTKTHTFDHVFKTMFAKRGEKRRIDEASAMGLDEYDKRGLRLEFEQAITAMRHCLLIRNQYAHALWHNPLNGLCFVDLEGLARQPAVIADLRPADFRYVDQHLLDEQEDFMTYAESCTTYINFERRRRLGDAVPSFSKPTTRKQPPLFLP